MNIKSFVRLAVAAGLLAFASLAVAQTYYADRATFQAANPGLDLETFNNGNVAAGNVCSDLAPWDSAQPAITSACA